MLHIDDNVDVYVKTPYHALTVFTERADPSLVTQGWVSDKSCLVTMVTRAYVTDQA
jgi:hypothetical protein